FAHTVPRCTPNRRAGAFTLTSCARAVRIACTSSSVRRVRGRFCSRSVPLLPPTCRSPLLLGGILTHLVVPSQNHRSATLSPLERVSCLSAQVSGRLLRWWFEQGRPLPSPGADRLVAHQRRCSPARSSRETPSDACDGRVFPMTGHSQGIVDSLDFSSVLERQEQGGVTLTFTVATDVTGKSEKVSALTLKNHVRDAKARLVESGMREAAATELLAPVAALVTDSSYWRLQSRGLIVFLAEGFFLPVRVPIELGDSLTVGEEFNLLPLAPVLASDRKLYVLALAQNSVRLFDSTRNVIE